MDTDILFIILIAVCLSALILYLSLKIYNLYRERRVLPIYMTQEEMGVIRQLILLHSNNTNTNITSNENTTEAVVVAAAAA
jgi:hypothetical protein